MANALVTHKDQLPQAQKMRRTAQYVRVSTDHRRYSIASSWTLNNETCSLIA
jgi:hypothetical protein